MNPPPHINNRNTSDISDISNSSQAPMSSQYYLEHIETSRNIMNNITEVLLAQERNVRLILLDEQYSQTNNPLSLYSANRNRNRNRIRTSNNEYNVDPSVEQGYGLHTANINSRNARTGNRRQPRNQPSRQSINTNTTSNFFQNIFRDLLNTTEGHENIIQFDLLTPVVVRPTEEQISAATREIVFSSISNPINNSCPIAQLQFQDNDPVLQIRHCNHNFIPANLKEWFTRSVVCPVCRYDIRTHNNSSGNSGNVAPGNTGNELDDDSDHASGNDADNDTGNDISRIGANSGSVDGAARSTGTS